MSLQGITPDAWLADWFIRQAGRTKAEVEANGQANYLESGWIDSFQFISLIGDIEAQFNIHFSNDEFQDRSFGTVSGLVRAIEKKLHGS